MSGILKTYFDGKKNKNSDNCACKYLTSYNNNLRLFNSGLLISENNILKIIKNPNNSNIKTKTKTNYTSKYCSTEGNSFNTNYFYPKKNNISFYEDFFIKKKKNKNINLFNCNKLPDLTINKRRKIIKENENNETFKFASQEKVLAIKDYIIKKKKKKNEVKSFTNIKDNTENSIEVEKIVHSLINSKNDDNDKKLHHVDSSQYLSYKNNKSNKKILFPKEKSISPASYIDVNLKRFPDEKELYRSFNTQLKSLNNKMEFRKLIMNQVDMNYRNRLKVEDLKNQHNNHDYNIFRKKEIEDLFIKQENNNKRSLHFNLYDYYNNIHKMKANSRYKFNKKFFHIEKKIENEFKNNGKLMTFDKKMENFENSTISAIKHLNSLSCSNRKMMKQILHIYDIYGNK